MRSSKPSGMKMSASPPTMTEKRGAGSSGGSMVQSLGPRQVVGGVMFTAYYPSANSVQIAGDFNNWRPDKSPMKNNGEGVWQVRVSLAKGTHHYRLVVDGQWQQDPNNEACEPNPYGGMNSVVQIG